MAFPDRARADWLVPEGTDADCLLPEGKDAAEVCVCRHLPEADAFVVRSAAGRYGVVDRELLAAKCPGRAPCRSALSRADSSDDPRASRGVAASGRRRGFPGDRPRTRIGFAPRSKPRRAAGSRGRVAATPRLPSKTDAKTRRGPATVGARSGDAPRASDAGALEAFERSSDSERAAAADRCFAALQDAAAGDGFPATLDHHGLTRRPARGTKRCLREAPQPCDVDRGSRRRRSPATWTCREGATASGPRRLNRVRAAANALLPGDIRKHAMSTIHQAVSKFEASKLVEPHSNDEGAPVVRGRQWTSHYYCGRMLGREAIPGSDGRCGPSDGPQCASCKRLQAAVKAGTLSDLFSERPPSTRARIQFSAAKTMERLRARCGAPVAPLAAVSVAALLEYRPPSGNETATLALDDALRARARRERESGETTKPPFSMLSAADTQRTGRGDAAGPRTRGGGAQRTGRGDVDVDIPRELWPTDGSRRRGRGYSAGTVANGRVAATPRARGRGYPAGSRSFEPEPAETPRANVTYDPARS